MTTENESPEADADDVAAESVPVEATDAPGTAEEQLAALREERDQYYDRFLRAQADLENLRKRGQKERTDAARYAAGPIVRDLLPVLDNLDRAVEAAESESDAANLVQGVQLVVKQLQDVLGGHAVQPIETENQTFDPNLHEALQQIPSPTHPPMTIVQEVERGYVLHDRVLRPAKVIVSSGPPAGDAMA